MSFRTFLLAIAVALSLTTTVHAKEISDGKFALTITAVPEWVIPVTAPTDTPKAEGAVQYLLVDSQAHQDSDGEISHFRHMVTQPRSPQGLESESQIQLQFRSAYERLELHDVSIVRNGKTINKLESPDIRFTQAEGEAGNLMYTGGVSATLFLTDVRLNDEIHYSYTVIGSNPVFENTFFSSEPLGWRVPLDRLHVSFSAPSKKKLYLQVRNTDRVFKKEKQNGFTRFRLDQDNIAPLFFENDYPNWHYPYPSVFVSEFKKWSDVSRWGAKLFGAVAEDINDDVITLAETLKEATNSPQEYTRAALEFVQDEIRYLSMSIGVNSHKPNSPASVLEKRYGDCKDKTTLFVALLAQAGIEAAPALVSYDLRQTVVDYLPAPSGFDHVIARVIIDDTTYWLDPTRTMQRGELAYRPVARFGKGLVLKDKQKHFSDIPYDPAKFNTIKVTETFDASEWSKDLTLTVKSVYRGSYAEYYRSLMTNSSLGEVMVGMQDYYAKFYDTVEMTDIQHEDRPEQNEFVMTEVYNLDDFWTIDEESQLRKADFYHSWVQQQLVSPNTLKRKTPLLTASPIHLQNDVVIKVMKGNEVTIGDDSEKLINTSTMDFRAKDSFVGLEYRSSLNMQLSSDHVMPAELSDFSAAMKTIDKQSGYSFRIGKPVYLQAEDDVETLMDRLQELGGVK